MPPRVLEDWKIVAEWLAAIGTLLAVVVALFAVRLERWWQGQPQLTLVHGQSVVLPPDSAEGKAVAFLCVENRGWRTAERAEVFAKTVSQRGPDGSCTRVGTFVPMSLRWAHAEPDHPDIFVTISPRIQRWIVLGALKQRRGEVYVELWTEYKRSTGANELTPGYYRIDVLLGASGIAPVAKHIWIEVPTTFDHQRVAVSVSDPE